MQVEGQHILFSDKMMATGGRVRNAYATYPKQGDNSEKLDLIPRNIYVGIYLY